MSGAQQADDAKGLVYMVTGVDEHGDTPIFVTSNKSRTEAQYVLMLDERTDVKANWLD